MGIITPPAPRLIARGHTIPTRRSIGLTLGVGLAGWAAVVGWSASPWAEYLHHDGLAEAGMAPALAVAVFVAGWLVMLSAMMLPTTYPLVSLFQQLTAQHRDRRRLVGALVAGYLSVWILAGLVAFAGDLALHQAAERVEAIHDNSWAVLAGTLGAAGAYQLSALKERCLTRCRSARAILMTRWRGTRPAAEALTIGARHGADCASCCWALMLVMFAVGAGNLAWMLGIAAVMTIEKNAPNGSRLTRPLGVGLLGAAGALVVLNA